MINNKKVYTIEEVFIIGLKMALLATGGNRTQSAKILGISRKCFRSSVNKYGLKFFATNDTIKKQIIIQMKCRNEKIPENIEHTTTIDKKIKMKKLPTLDALKKAAVLRALECSHTLIEAAERLQISKRSLTEWLSIWGIQSPYNRNRSRMYKVIVDLKNHISTRKFNEILEKHGVTL